MDAAEKVRRSSAAFKAGEAIRIAKEERLREEAAAAGRREEAAAAVRREAAAEAYRVE